MRYRKPHFIRYVIVSPLLRALSIRVLGEADTETGLNINNFIKGNACSRENGERAGQSDRTVTPMQIWFE